MPRMKILNSVEREVFDFPPIFNSVERKRCFDFPTPLQDIATSLRTASNVTRRKVQNEQELIRRQPQDLQFLPCSPREQPCK